MTSVSRTTSNTGSPPSALRWSRQTFLGERSRYREWTRERAKCYQMGSYTSRVPESMPEEMETGVRDRVAAAYEGYYDLLQYIAVRRYKIPLSDIRPLIHDVFVNFLRYEALIGDDRRWLTTAVTNACLNYWRDRKPGVPLPNDLRDSRRVVDDALTRHDLARVLKRLSSDCERVLRLHYLDELQAPEIAALLDTTPGYIRLKIHRCLEYARRAIAEPE